MENDTHVDHGRARRRFSLGPRVAAASQSTGVRRGLRFVPPRSPKQLREMVLGGERWDYRPGQCVWRQLVQPAFYPETEIVYADTISRLLVA